MSRLISPARAIGVCIGLAVAALAALLALLPAPPRGVPAAAYFAPGPPAPGPAPNAAPDPAFSPFALALRDAIGEADLHGVAPETVVRVMHESAAAVAAADFDRTVALLASLGGEPDGDLAEQIRRQLAARPPRHRPADLDAMTPLDLLHLRNAHRSQPLVEVLPGTLFVRVVPVPTVAAMRDALEERRLRQRGWAPDAGETFGLSSTYPLRMRDAPELEASPRLIVSFAAVAPRGTRVRLTFFAALHPRRGCVPLLFDMDSARTPEQQRWWPAL